MEAPKLHYILAKLKFVFIEYNPVFCVVKKEIEGVIEGSFDVRVVEQGVIYDLHFAGDVLYYFIVPPSVGISRCKVALGHPEVHESPSFWDEGGQRLEFFI